MTRPRQRQQANTMQIASNKCRRIIVSIVFIALFSALLGRAFYLQYHQKSALQSEADKRHVKTVEIPTQRGEITDRANNLLAFSTPVYSVWIDPKFFDVANVEKLRDLPGVDIVELGRKLVKAKSKRRFIYVKRHLPPHEVSHISELNIAGLNFKKEYRRYYPNGEISAHIVGVVDIDGNGIEGIEKVFDPQLHNSYGIKKMVRDRRNRTIRPIELIKRPLYGERVELSIDQRIQYSAYRALREAMEKHNAKSGSVVVLDVKTGEILAIANDPSFNPNERGTYEPDNRRNRGLIDMFEPGSTVKPFIIATLIENSPDKINAEVDTSPGYYKFQGKRIEDVNNYGVLDLSGIVVKSSNVGISKVAAMLSKEEMWSTFDRIGYGRMPGTSFPGEVGGRLYDYADWQELEQRIMSYGYGIAVSLIQLANSYTIFANDGWQPSLSLLKGNPHFEKRQVFSAETAQAIRAMLSKVTLPDGTGNRAKVSGYTTAGKTGTVRKIHNQEADNQEYLSLFVGFAPVSNPRLAVAVMIDTPQGKEYYGGQVAGPVFSNVMRQALRLSNISNDEPVLGQFTDAEGFKRASQ